MTARYGLPYQGSKNTLAERIVSLLPDAGGGLVDLFAGGCAVTHAALSSGKYTRVLANDIGPWPGIFRDSAIGIVPFRWVSREEFLTNDGLDPLLLLCFGFGYKTRTYYTSPDKEALDLSAYSDICRGRIRYEDRGSHVEPLVRYRSLVNSFSAHPVDASALIVSRRDYRSVHIPAEAVVYCDPPYLGTEGYGRRPRVGEFDHHEFYAYCRWLARRGTRVFVSEYRMPSDFECIAEWKKQVLGCSGHVGFVMERLFTVVRV